MTLKLILAFVIAFAVSAVVGFFLVPYLRRIKAGQSIKENGPTWHMSKQGTPTMGGLMFIAAIAVVCLSVGFECMAEGEYGHLFCLAFALVFGAIGFLDDYEKLKKKQNLGLTAGKKLLLQLAAAVAFIFLMRRFGYVALDSLYIPFWNKTVPVSEPLYVIFAAFVIVGTVNSVNLTDGVDGLAASTTMPVCIFFAVISMLWGERFLSLGVFASGIAGGLLGFLIYNFHPAKVFMGDTGSLFLGGAVAVSVESKQVRRSHRVEMSMPAAIARDDGHLFSCTVHDYSDGGLGVKIHGEAQGLESQHVKLLLKRGQQEYAFPVRVARVNGSEVGLQLLPLSNQQHIDFVQCTFARADTWALWQDSFPEDKPMESLLDILKLGFRGYRHLAEFSPPSVKVIFRSLTMLVAWFVSFIPRRPERAAATLSAEPAMAQQC